MMCGSWLGALGMILVLGAVARRVFGWHSCGAYGHGGCGGRRHWGGWGHHHRGGWRGPAAGSGWAARGVARMLFRQLDTTPGQEKVILAELETLEDALRSLRGETVGVRAGVAELFRKDIVDDAAVDAALARAQQRVDAARTALREALQRVHDALDENQRKRLADLLEGRRPAPDGMRL